MKRLSLVLAAVMMLAVLAGCSNAPGGAANPFEGKDVGTILDELYAGVEIGIPSLVTTQITAENEAFFLGTTGLKIKEGIASEPAISSIPYSVCVIRLEEGEDVAAAVKAIQENANPAKWICVQVDPQNVIVDSAGDVIILIMTDEFAGALHDNFKALAQK